MLIDINDYKNRVTRNVKRIIIVYFLLSILFFIGLIIINKSFKYYDYYTVSSEYKDKLLNMYVLTNDVKKITNNNKMKINNEIFAYTIKSISKENIYMNGNYYKLLELKVDNIKLEENEIIESRIIVSEDSLIRYIFKTIWR